MRSVKDKTKLAGMKVQGRKEQGGKERGRKELYLYPTQKSHCLHLWVGMGGGWRECGRREQCEKFKR